MTDDQAQVARKALQRIAADYEVTGGGHRKRLARQQAISIARQACERLGIDYSGNSARGRPAS